MNILSQALSRIRNVGSQAGFTMIELLIVISIIGILAVAVLSAINPVEQINRGRDTGSESDAEQLISAIDRFHAFQGYYPWLTSPSTNGALAWTEIVTGTTWADGGTPACPVWEKLSTATTTGCTGSNELKATFFNRIQKTTYNNLFVYNNGGQGESTYVCFVPQSAAFRKKAEDRCTDAAGAGLPSDIDTTTKGTICGGYGSPSGTVYYCLP